MRRWGFAVSRREVFERVQVFGDPDSLRVGMATLFRVPTMRIPRNMAMTFDGKVLVVPSRELHHRQLAEVAEDYEWSEANYRADVGEQANMKVHQVVVGGEKRMGSPWFFQGLASYGSFQFNEQLPLSSGEFKRWLVEEEKGAGHHSTHMRLVKTLTQRVPVGELIRHAADPGFPKAYLNRLK